MGVPIRDQLSHVPSRLRLADRNRTKGDIGLVAAGEMSVPTRGQLACLPSELLSSGRNRTKADVRLFDLGTRRVVLKDFSTRGFLVRNTIGRFSVAREARALDRLRSAPGIPALVGRIDRHALVWEFLPGKPLPRLGRGSLPAAFFDALDRILEEVHERGVAVADLHHRNVLLDEATGRPGLLDFSLAILAPRSRWNLAGRWLFERARTIDRIAVARIRMRYEAPGETPDSRGAPPSSLYRSGRALKRLSRRLRGKP